MSNRIAPGEFRREIQIMGQSAEVSVCYVLEYGRCLECGEIHIPDNFGYDIFDVPGITSRVWPTKIIWSED